MFGLGPCLFEALPWGLPMGMLLLTARQGGGLVTNEVESGGGRHDVARPLLALSSGGAEYGVLVL